MERDSWTGVGWEDINGVALNRPKKKTKQEAFSLRKQFFAECKSVGLHSVLEGVKIDQRRRMRWMEQALGEVIKTNISRWWAQLLWKMWVVVRNNKPLRM